MTIAGDAIASVTPLFLGANPAEVRHDGIAVIRPCAREEDAARDLLASLDAGQRSEAVICDVAPPDFVLQNLPNVPDARDPEIAPDLAAFAPLAVAFDALTPPQRAAMRFERAHPRGLSAAKMSASQRSLFGALRSVYIDRLTPELAGREHARIERDDADGLYFAWAGSLERRAPHYYRIQGGDLLIEYDNTQDGANHVHTVCRSIGGDFGGDALREHLRRAH